MKILDKISPKWKVRIGDALMISALAIVAFLVSEWMLLAIVVFGLGAWLKANGTPDEEES